MQTLFAPESDATCIRVLGTPRDATGGRVDIELDEQISVIIHCRRYMVGLQE